MAFSGSWANRQNGQKRDGFDAVVVRVGDGVEVASASRVIVTRGPPVPVHGLQDPVRPETLTVYDAGGNVLQVTDPKGNVTDNTYDALGRLISTKTYPDTGETIEVKFQHDDAGNRFKVTDANDFTTVFHYDGLNRNTKLVHPNQDEKVFTYDAVHMLSRTDENGATTSYSYDNFDRLQTVTYPDSNTRTYIYDAVGNILTVDETHDESADVAYSYDALNRAVSETSNGVTHTYTYDVLGNLRKTVHGNTGRVITSTYDAHNRLAAMTEDGRRTAYYYDARGLVVGKQLPNDQLIVNDYDAAGKKLAAVLWNELTQDTQTYEYAYGYDLAGNVVDTQEDVTGKPLRTVAMGYDDVYRLISETIVDDGDTTLTTYGYDPNSNRLGKSVQVNGGAVANTTFVLDGAGLNQLVQVQNPDTSTVDFTYDDNGNRITKTDADGVDTYSYDFENRLIALDDKVTGGATDTYAYVYDYRTRRVTRDESAAASGDTTRLVFSAGLSIQEYDNEAPATGTPDVETIRGSDWGGGIGGVLYTLRNGAPSYNHYNNRGDVVAKTDATGSLTYQAGYEAFGTRTREDGSTEDRQKANTKDEDPWGGLNEGMRYRDLEFGVWLTRDPLGFVDGPNLYAYVRQNPWSYFDPHGLISGFAGHNPETAAVLQQAHNEQQARLAAGNPTIGDRFFDGTTRLVLDSLPVLGTAKGFDEAANGVDRLSGRPLDGFDRTVAGVGTAAGVLPFGKVASGLVGKAVKALKNGADKVVQTAKSIARQSDVATDAAASLAKGAPPNTLDVEGAEVFSGVYSPETGNVHFRPSYDGDAEVPEGWVPRRGGHTEVWADEAFDGGSGQSYGYTIFKDGDDLAVEWKSGLNREFNDDGILPEEMRDTIIKKLEDETGKVVRSR